MVLLLHGDGADASTYFEDHSNSHHAVTANGTIQIDTAQSVFGGASILGNNATTAYLSIADSADWAFGAGDFVIDCRVRFASTPLASGKNCFLWSQYADTNNRIYWLCRDNGAVQFYVQSGGSNIASYSKAVSFSADTWYHLALVRNSTTMLLFVDGVDQSWTETVAIGASSMPDLSAAVTFPYTEDTANWSSDPGQLDGWLDEFRVLKGTNYGWTSNFTVPTVAYKNPTLSSSSS